MIRTQVHRAGGRAVAVQAARALLLASLCVVACSEDDDDSGPTIPDPVQVSTSDVATETENVYYREWCTGGEVIPEAEAILGELLDADIAISRIWFPMQCSPCDCVTCTAAIVLELFAPDSRVEAMGFIPDNPWAMNCGVGSMWRYTFPESGSVYP